MIRFCVRAIGKLKNKAELFLIEEYRSRLINQLEIQEIETKRQSASFDLSKQEEGRLLLSGLKSNVYKIALDERGELLSSRQLSELISKKSSEGYSSFVFFIGGANGLHDVVRNASDKVISFGRITLPHMLARVVLVEQIYRIERIMENHPYDR